MKQYYRAVVDFNDHYGENFGLGFCIEGKTAIGCLACENKEMNICRFGVSFRQDPATIDTELGWQIIPPAIFPLDIN